MKLYFQASAGDTCLLFTNQGLANIVQGVMQVCQFILVYTKKFYASKAFMYAFFSIAYCFLLAECPWFSLIFYNTPQELFCGMFFILEIENSLTLPCIKLCVTGISLREDEGLCKHTRCSSL